MKAIVRSPVGDTKYFDIVRGVWQGNVLSQYMFIICVDYVLRASIDLMKENGFTLKSRSRWYTAETMTEAEYTDMIQYFLQIHLLKPNPCCIA